MCWTRNSSSPCVRGKRGTGIVTDLTAFSCWDSQAKSWPGHGKTKTLEIGVDFIKNKPKSFRKCRNIQLCASFTLKCSLYSNSNYEACGLLMKEALESNSKTRKGSKKLMESLLTGFNKKLKAVYEHFAKRIHASSKFSRGLWYKKSESHCSVYNFQAWSSLIQSDSKSSWNFYCHSSHSDHTTTLNGL